MRVGSIVASSLDQASVVRSEIARKRTADSAILATKLGPPRLRSLNIVARERLDTELAKANEVALTILGAPAGYGKSTALAEWFRLIDRESCHAAWLTVDETDDDPLLFANHIVAAMCQSAEPVGRRLRPTPEHKLDIDLRATSTAIVNAIDQCGRSFFLVIEDLHNVTNPDVVGLLGMLAISGSQWLHLVISSRTQPPLKLAKLRAQGQLRELGAQNLKFSLEETSEFLTIASGQTCDDELVAEVFDKTEGWAAGIRLVALSLTGQQPAHLPQMMPRVGTGVEEFLQDEVLERLPLPVAEFVRSAGIIGEFSAELCNSVLACNDSAARIEELEALQMFISRVGDPGWFRFHQLFSDAISNIGSRTDPERKADIHRRASAWFENNGFPGRAVRHAHATGELLELASVLNRVAPQLVQAGREGLLTRYALMLPNELLLDFPELQLERVYALTLTWQFSEASRILRDVRAACMNTQRTAQWTANGVDLDRILRKQTYCEMQLAILKDEMVKAEGLARQWLSMEGGYSFYDDAVSQTSLIYAQREQFNCHSIAAAGRARELFLNNGNRWGTIWHDCIIGAGYAQIGQLTRARVICDGAYSTALEVIGRDNPATAIPALHLAELQYEMNDVDQADALVSEFLPLATKIGLVDQLVAGYQTKVRLAALTSLPAALQVLDEGQEIAVAREFDRLSSFLVADRIRLLAAAGENAEVRKVALINNLGAGAEAFYPSKGQTTGAAARAFAAAHLALTENNLSGADALLRRWMRFLEDNGFVRIGLRFAMVLAQVQIVMGDSKATHRTLRAALQAGAKAGFIRTFCDANPAVRMQIESMSFLPTGPDSELISFHELIVGAFGRKPERPSVKLVDLDEIGGQYDALNDRESEILLMVATGMMNSQIASEAGLTLGTVKWYLQQIYGKLGVNRRSEAVFKARQLGLIG
jgi:LuxR family transcriptional regulator, maltose regulon positive regulatory protein